MRVNRERWLISVHRGARATRCAELIAYPIFDDEGDKASVFERALSTPRVDCDRIPRADPPVPADPTDAFEERVPVRGRELSDRDQEPAREAALEVDPPDELFTPYK